MIFRNIKGKFIWSKIFNFYYLYKNRYGDYIVEFALKFKLNRDQDGFIFISLLNSIHPYYIKYCFKTISRVIKI